MKDCHNLYLKYDVWLLADVFEKIESNGLKTFGLFPNHYLGALASSWDTMLNMTKVEVELHIANEDLDQLQI